MSQRTFQLIPTRGATAVCLAVATLLAGCNFAPTLAINDLPVPALLDATRAAAPANDEALDLVASFDWVRSYALREAMALALSHNRDLRVALANVERARALYGVSQSQRLPNVAAVAQGSRARGAADLSTTGVSAISTQYTAQLAFTSYEIDFWGRVRNLNEAALQQFLQSSENQRHVQLALLADVANAWLNLSADLAQLELAQVTLASRQKAFELTREMHAVGATSGLVLAQNQTTVDSARGAVATYTAQVARDRNALRLLTGGDLPEALLPTARTLQGSVSDPPVVATLPPDLPSAVLLQRPDVAAAEHALRVMNANIGAARAALFPSITLTASVGSGSRELDRLFTGGNSTWSFLPQINVPIFDAGRRRAEVRVAQADRDAALSQYERAIQIAFRESADALADRGQWQERLDAQTSLVAATQRAFDLSEARFKAGVDDYLTVLDAQRNLYAAQQSLIQLRLGDQVNHVTLYKVLGGLQPQ